MKSPIKKVNGVAEWEHKQGDMYVATGVCPRGKRRGSVTGNSWFHIKRINLYRGSRWLLRGGKRYLIERVIN